MKVVIVLATLLSVAAAQTCPGGFTQVGSACYTIPDESLSWTSARNYCRALTLPDGEMASLARVDTCDQLRALTQYIKTQGYPTVNYWLGGTTVLDPDGAFRWESTGGLVPMGPPLWFPTQPDYPVLERALSLSKTGYFADEMESLDQRFICQVI